MPPSRCQRACISRKATTPNRIEAANALTPLTPARTSDQSLLTPVRDHGQQIVDVYTAIAVHIGDARRRTGRCAGSPSDDYCQQVIDVDGSIAVDVADDRRIDRDLFFVAVAALASGTRPVARAALRAQANVI